MMRLRIGDQSCLNWSLMLMLTLKRPSAASQVDPEADRAEKVQWRDSGRRRLWMAAPGCLFVCR